MKDKIYKPLADKIIKEIAVNYYSGDSSKVLTNVEKNLINGYYKPKSVKHLYEYILLPDGSFAKSKYLIKGMFISNAKSYPENFAGSLSDKKDYTDYSSMTIDVFCVHQDGRRSIGDVSKVNNTLRLRIPFEDDELIKEAFNHEFIHWNKINEDYIPFYKEALDQMCPPIYFEEEEEKTID